MLGAAPLIEVELDLAKPRAKLTLDVLKALRENDAQLQALATGDRPIDRRIPRIRVVRVKEFAFSRWQGKWVFLLALLGMAAGAGLSRAGELRRRTDAQADAAIGEWGHMLSLLRGEVQDLCKTVDGLEADELDLEEAVKAFERGVEITKACHQRLDEAERKVRQLRQHASGEVTEEPFSDEEEGA